MSAMRLRYELLPRAMLAERSSEWRRGVLGVVGFAAQPPMLTPGLPTAVCGTAQLDGAGELCEVWSIGNVLDENAAPVAVTHDRLERRSSDTLTFGAVSIDERVLRESGAVGEAAALREATDTAYRTLFDALRGARHPHLIRVWNYLPDINRHADGDERYRHFNAARRAAFERAGRASTETAPAATAVGCAAGKPLTVFFLAGAAPPIMIENPRQVSAYHYPPQYGRESPLFSRACLLRAAGEAHLFISGTASIVGHRTLHPGDVAAQAREALVNLSILVEEAGRRRAQGEPQIDGLRLKVYLRRVADLESVRAEIGRHPLSVESIVYLEADICREDLLVEIEAYGHAASC